MTTEVAPHSGSSTATQNLGVYEHWLTRLGPVLVLVFFSAYDAIAGIATGLAMRDARDLPVAEQEVVFEVVKDWPGFEPAVFAIGAVAVVGMVLALAMLTIGARRLQVGRGQEANLRPAEIRRTRSCVRSRRSLRGPTKQPRKQR